MFKKIALGLTGLVLAVTMGLQFGATNAWANKVDCGKVMDEVGAGKKAGEIAKDLSISTSSVYRCKKKAKAAGGSTAASSSSAASSAASPASGASPAAMESPAATTKTRKHKKSKASTAASPAAAASPGM